MSLYGGISFGGDTPAIVEPIIATEAVVSAPTDSSSSAITTEAEKAKPIVWSSALNFAPNRRKKVLPSQPTNSIPLSLQSVFNSAEVSNVNKGPRIVTPFKSALSIPTITAAPSLYSSSSNSVASTSAVSLPTATAPVRSGRILQAPSMTLDEEDVNGFLQTAKGKRAAGKQQGKGNKKKKKGGAIKEDLLLGFDDTVYEPSKPCDYSAYKAHLQAQRTQRRLDREEERRRERSPSGSSYYSSDEKSGDEQQSSKKARLFAPPTSYNSPPPSSDDSPMLLPPTFTSAPLSQPNLNAAPRAETGEEAYLRRVALSAGGPPKPALPSQQQPQYPTFSSASTSSGPSFTGYTPPASIHTPSVASTSSYNLQLPPPPPPNFIPPPTTFGPFIPSDVSFPPSQPSLDFDGVPIDPTIPVRPVPSSFPLSDAAIRARDIAQRLGKLASMQPPTPTPPPAFVASSTSFEPDNRPFAERLMSKFGWKEGQGLGAEESGITSALSVSKATTAPHPNSKKAKKAAAEVPSAPVSAMSSGRIIDAARSGRNAQQVAEIGEPSRVVLLTNLCGREDVDDDLGGEVAEEASKFGVVDRCFVYLVPGETRDDEAVRIFLVMSGLAGGYNAVSRFGGRFFGGRVVKARYYDERTFNAGEHRM